MAIGNIKVNVAGAWKTLNTVTVNVGGLWKEVSGVYINNAGVWQQVYATSQPIPAGAIVPYRGVGTPTGFTDFTAADGRFIVGAGTTYPVGSTGGSTTTAVSGSANTTGGHSGGTTFLTDYPANGAGTGYYSGDTTAGSHSHTWSQTVNSEDTHTTFKLIKASSEQSELPADSLILSHTTLSTAIGGITNVETAGRFIKSSTVAGTAGGSSTSSGSVGTSAGGSHRHGIIRYGNDTDFENAELRYRNNTTGNHSHTMNFSATLNTKCRYLSAWTNAAAAFPLQANSIMMWESATPPAGYVICDGTNNTPDMRDYFVRNGTTIQANGTAGNNSVTYSGSSTAAGNHNHRGAYVNTFDINNNNGRHSNNLNNHTHTSSVAKTIIQSYYALYFIMSTQ